MEVLREFVPEAEDHRDEELDRRAEADTFREDIVVRPFNAEQQQVVDVSHGPRSSEQWLVLFCEATFCGAIVLMRTLAFEFHQRAELIVIDGVHQLLFGVPEPSKVLLRQIDPSLLRVGPDITQYVCQLERDAEIHGVLFRPFMMIPEHFGADEPNSGSGAVAILLKLPKRLVPVLHKVHLHSLQQIEEMVGRDVKFLDDTDKPVQNGKTGNTLEGQLQLIRPYEKAAVLLLDICFLIDNIVGVPAESVDGLDCLAFWRRKKEDWQQKVAFPRRSHLGKNYVNGVCCHRGLSYE